MQNTAISNMQLKTWLMTMTYKNLEMNCDQENN